MASVLRLASVKRCTTCGVLRPLTEFVKNKTTRSGRGSMCHPCKREHTRQVRSDPIIRARDYRSIRAGKLRKKYGLTPAQVDEMFEKQGGRCAICGTDRPTKKGSKPFVIDHDHATGVVRALLCHSCNFGIGNLGDDPNRLMAAAEYIWKHRLPRLVLGENNGQ